MEQSWSQLSDGKAAMFQAMYMSELHDMNSTLPTQRLLQVADDLGFDPGVAEQSIQALDISISGATFEQFGKFLIYNGAIVE